MEDLYAARQRLQPPADYDARIKRALGSPQRRRWPWFIAGAAIVAAYDLVFWIIAAWWPS